MLESRSEDALVKLVKTVETVETVEAVETVETAFSCCVLQFCLVVSPRQSIDLAATQKGAWNLSDRA